MKYLLACLLVITQIQYLTVLKFHIEVLTQSKLIVQFHKDQIIKWNKNIEFHDNVIIRFRQLGGE